MKSVSTTLIATGIFLVALSAAVAYISGYEPAIKVLAFGVFTLVIGFGVNLIKS